MGYQTLPSTSDYWNKEPGLGVKVVSDVMPRDCIFELRSALHFVDNQKPQEKNKKAWKIRLIINYFNQAFSHAMGLTNEQAIDEHMIKFKKQHLIKQYMPLKPIKRGFKMWCRNELGTGYLFQFDIYTGKKQNREGGVGKNVVMQLSRSLIGTKVRLYFKISLSGSDIYQVTRVPYHDRVKCKLCTKRKIDSRTCTCCNDCNLFLCQKSKKNCFRKLRFGVESNILVYNISVHYFNCYAV